MRRQLTGLHTHPRTRASLRHVASALLSTLVCGHGYWRKVALLQEAGIEGRHRQVSRSQDVRTFRLHQTKLGLQIVTEAVIDSEETSDDHEGNRLVPFGANRCFKIAILPPLARASCSDLPCYSLTSPMRWRLEVPLWTILQARLILRKQSLPIG